MKKLFSIFCCLLLSASMVTQAQESPIRDADVSATSSQIIADETELLDDGIYVGDVTGPRKAPAATAYAMMKNSTVQYAEIMKLSTTNCYKIIIKVTNNYGGALKTGFVVTSFNTGSNTKIGGNHQFSSSYSNCTESDNWFTQNYSSSTGALYVDNPYGYIQFTYQSMGADGYPIYRIYIHDCYGYTYNNGCINWKSSGAIFSWDNNVSVHPMNANKDRIDFTDYYTISVSSNNNSYGTVSGGGTYAAGAARTLTASVASSSYQFLGWKKNGGSTYVSTSASYNVTVNGNDSYVAEFAPKAAPQYTITTAVSPSNTYGTVTGAGSYYENNPATLTATSANEHLYIFDHWLKDGNNYAGGATITPTVTAAATYTAVFRAAAAGTITAATNNASYGTATASPSGNQPGGTAVTLTTTPNAGYAFTQWNDGNTDNPRTVYVDGNKTYTAQFVVETPLCAAVKYNTANHEILWAKHGDSDWNPDYQTWYDTPDNFVRVRASDYTDNSMNHIQLCFWVDDYSITYNGTIGPKEGTYVVAMAEVMASGNKNNYWWLDKDTYLNKAVVGFNENQGLSNSGWNTSQARIWSTSQSPYIAYIANQTCDYCSPTDFLGVPVGSTVKVARGKGGNCYVEVRNALGRLLFTIGEPAQPYTLAWDANGGELSGTYTAAGSVNEGTSITAPTATRTGYTFTGWLPAFTGTMPSANTTYTAQWTAIDYEINFHGNGGTGSFFNLTYTIEEEDDIVLWTDEDIEKTGYTFGGWYDNADLTGNPVTTIPAGSTGNKDFYAKWIINTYTITWKNADGTTLETDENVAYGTTPTYNGSTPTKEADSEYTYAFNGWSPAVATVTTDATYTAAYSQTKVQYTLTWNFDGGTTATAEGNYTHGTIDWGTAITAPANPTKDGYTFNGWNTTPAATMPAANVTYTAQWVSASAPVVLYDYKDNDYYNNFKTMYNGKTINVTYERQFTKGRWSTLCLPFNVNKSRVSQLFGSHIYEFKYATGNANEGSGVNLFFSIAKGIEAGKGYIVNADATLAACTLFTFLNVNIDLSKDNGAELSSVTAYDNLTGNSSGGNIELVGTLRKGTLQGTKKDNRYMGLKNNKIYYPNITTGSTILAYRGIFRSIKETLNAERIRIIVDGEEKAELEVINGELQDVQETKKFIENGVLYIERNGVIYDATGRKVE